MPSLLLVDDDNPMLNILERLTRSFGFDVDTAPGGTEALKALDKKCYDVVMTDLMMPEIDGFSVLQHALGNERAKAVIIVTAAGSIPLAVQAMRAGAADMLTKPVDKAALESSLHRVTHIGGISADESFVAWRKQHAPDLIGDHASLIESLSIIQRVAPTDCTVLVTGASGTGKELFARAVHSASGREGKPFVALNCAAIPKDLMETELFGHAKGAFTGANDKREGKFAVAEGGTLFLDEIGEMNLEMQAKLLRVLQDKEFTPIGEAKARKADVRIVAATNRDLQKRVSDGQFREDLYYRLNVIPVELPTLRERPNDILPLARHFVRWANQRHSRTIAGFDTLVESALVSYGWPGNVREMQNLIERLVILSRGNQITARDLPSHMGSGIASTATIAPAVPAPLPQDLAPPSGIKLTAALEHLERRLTLDALQQSAGNKAKAAELLGLKRTTLVERLKKLNIVVDDI